MKNFHWIRWESSLPGLRTLGPPLSPPSPVLQYKCTQIVVQLGLGQNHGPLWPELFRIALSRYCTLSLQLAIAIGQDYTNSLCNLELTHFQPFKMLAQFLHFKCMAIILSGVNEKKKIMNGNFQLQTVVTGILVS